MCHQSAFCLHASADTSKAVPRGRSLRSARASLDDQTRRSYNPAVCTFAELISAMEQIAPTRHAEAWDNVGLLAGDPGQPGVSSVLLTIDYTAEVAEEGSGSGAMR